MRKLKLLLSGLAFLVGGVLSANAQASYNFSWTEGVEAAAGDNYFLYNVGSGRFLTKGLNWGTHASADHAGRVVKLESLPNGGYSIYNYHYSVNNGVEGKAGYLTKNSYVDTGSNDAEWVFESTTVSGYTHAYKIHDYNTSNYLYYNTSDEAVNIGNDTNDNYSIWLLIPMSSRQAVGDYTYNLINTDFVAAWEQKAWSGSKANNDDVIAVGGNSNNRCAEKYGVARDISQTIAKNVPNGRYRIYAQGFWRQDGGVTEDAPVLYANSDTKALSYIAGSENNMTDASNSFSAGLYENIIETIVTDHTLRVGVNITGSHQWVIFDNFIIRYMGESVLSDVQDVTSTYITNADFSTGTPIGNHVPTYGKDMAGNNTTFYGAQAISGWTNASAGVADNGYENCGIAGALFAYGGTPWLGGAGTPAPAPSGNTGNAAGLCAVWGNRIQYTQDVTLPAGYYTIKFDVYNATTNNGSGKFITTNLFGFIADNGTAYCAPNNTFAIGQWTPVAVSFKLDAATAGKVSMGYVGPGGNADMPHLFVDNVKILSQTDYTDYTNKVGTAINTAWTTPYSKNMESQTYDGVQMACVYNDSKPTGYALKQTITELPAGMYDVELYALSQNDWQDNALRTDAGDVAYVAAEGKYTLKTWINARSEYNVEKKHNLGIYSISGIPVYDGNLTLGLAIAKSGKTAWQNIQIKKLTRVGDVKNPLVEEYYEARDRANAVDLSKTIAPSIKTALQNAISQYASVDEASDNALNEAIDALKKATKKANQSIASYAIIASGKVSTSNLSGWTCTNNNTFHINTWSVEGNSDGSDMKTPFIENWINYTDGKLGEGIFSYTLECLEPGETYYAQALIRSYNEANSDAPNGPDFFINNAVTKLSEKGKNCTYHYEDRGDISGLYATLGGTATVDAEGKLTLGAKIASDANYNWVAFKDVSIESLTDALNRVIAEAEALYPKLRTEVKTQLQAVVDANKTASGSAVENAIKNIREAIAAAKVNNRIPMEGTYYVQHVASGKYMAAGSTYGTHGIINETGLDLTLKANADTRTVSFNSDVWQGNNHFLNNNLYMDNAEYGWIIENMSDDTYCINLVDNDGTQYIGVNADNDLVLVSEPVAWKFILPKDVLAARMATLDEATTENGVDATWLLKNPNFNRNDYRVRAWEISEDCTNNNLNGGNDLNNCAESYKSVFTISQTVTNVPAGIYKMTAQGFYRQESDTQESAPVFFIGKNATDISTAEVPVRTGTENNMSAASEAFTTGSYTIDPIEYKLASDQLTVGIKGTAANQWVCFDNFRLTYYGPVPAEKSQMEPVLAIAKALAADETKTEGKEALNAAIAKAEEDLENFSTMNYNEFGEKVKELEKAIDDFRKIYRVKFEDGAYYVQLASDAKKFIAAGSKSGTRGIVNETGLDLTLTFNDNNTVTFDSKVLTDGKHFLGVAGDSLTMDAASKNWSIEKISDNTYSISDDERYISIDESGLLVWSEIPEAWKIIKKDVIVAERSAKLAEASEDNGVDVTWMLQNPNFNRNDQRVKEWKTSGTVNKNGGNNENNCAESYKSKFTASQTLKDMPIGIYKLTAQGFYRKEDNNDSKAPQFFYGTEKDSVFADVPAIAGTENNMSDASASFSKGDYAIEPLEFSLSSNGNLIVGVMGTATNQWVCFDNFRLTYYGLSTDEATTKPKAKANLFYTGEPQVLIVGGSHEPEGDETQYTIKYSMDKDDLDSFTDNAEDIKGTEAGSYEVWYRVVDEDDNPVLAIKKLTVEIAPAKAADVFDVKLSETEYTYDGTAKEPEATVTSSLGALEAGTDYTISYANNTNAGTAKVIVTGQGNYGGTKEVEFNIAKLQLTSFVLTDTLLVYNEQEQTVGADSVMAGEMMVPADAYTLSGNVQTAVGTHTVTLTAKEDGNFEGELTAEFTIKGSDIDVCDMTLETYSYTYNGKERKPAVTVTRGDKQLTEGVDYTLSYTSNVNAGTAKAIITGIGNYSGTKETQFKITQGVGDIEMLNKEVTMPYNAGSFIVKPMVLLGDGPLRYASSNDSVAQVIYYTGEIFINSIGKTTITINMGSTPNATADTTSFVLTVTPASATLVNITRLSMGYGMPNFKVSSIRETLTEGKDYTLSYKDTEGKAVTEADMLAKPGRYVVVANLKGNYEGTQELEFTVSVDPTATGIDAVTGDDDGTVRYDVNGRRVEKTRRGLIIENGKKRYVKK